MRREIKHNGGKSKREGVREREEMERMRGGKGQRERYGEQGRLIEQLREERAVRRGSGRDMVWQIKEERGAAANCSPYDASLGLRAADSAC